MAYIDLEKSVGIGYLCDWYQNSIMDNVPPVWTDEHLEELLKDFIVIPKDTPTADVVEVVRCKDCGSYNKHYGECALNGSHFGENGYCCRGTPKERGGEK